MREADMPLVKAMDDNAGRGHYSIRKRSFNLAYLVVCKTHWSPWHADPPKLTCKTVR